MIKNKKHQEDAHDIAKEVQDIIETLTQGDITTASAQHISNTLLRQEKYTDMNLQGAADQLDLMIMCKIIENTENIMEKLIQKGKLFFPHAWQAIGKEFDSLEELSRGGEILKNFKSIFYKYRPAFVFGKKLFIKLKHVERIELLYDNEFEKAILYYKDFLVDMKKVFIQEGIDESIIIPESAEYINLKDKNKEAVEIYQKKINLSLGDLYFDGIKVKVDKDGFIVEFLQNLEMNGFMISEESLQPTIAFLQEFIIYPEYNTWVRDKSIDILGNIIIDKYDLNSAIQLEGLRIKADKRGNFIIK